ncbi:MAG TPA: GPW/gp25 family protein [Candidatus Paceibacterota bacterium]
MALSTDTQTAAETEIDLFGTDLYFSDDLQLTSTGDYSTVEGQDALKQAIKIRLITAPGEYAVHPEFGCGVTRWVKKRMSQADMDNLRQTIIDQMSKEPRIQKVNDVAVDLLTTGTGVKITVRVTALGREQSFATNVFSE